MAEKQIYPMISEKAWWQIRNQFKKTIPSVVNVSYLKSLLNLNSDQSARNIISPLKQMGIIDTEGKPQPRATDWRSDAKYAEVCATIITEIYPQELLDLFPDARIDTSSAKSWFMDTCSLGDNAATKITSTFSLLKSGDVKTEVGMPSSNKPTKQVKNIPTGKSAAPPKVLHPQQDTPLRLHDQTTVSPSVHIDLQIHISPEASAEQIDSIFASMAKHLYGRG